VRGPQTTTHPPKNVRSMLKILLLGSAIYAMLCLAFFVFQPRFVYFPMKAIAATPAAIGLAYEDLLLDTGDGTSLHGWYLPGRADAHTLLFLHGNAGNISHRLDSLRLFNSLGLNILIFDYSGFGQSGGTAGEQQTYDDARVAWNYLTDTRGVAPEQIIVFGRSLGGGVATWLATQRTPAGLILESSFTSVPALAQKFYPVFPVRWLARIRYDNAARLPTVRCPVLIAHSRDDELVPISHGRELFALAKHPKRFLAMVGGHNNGFMVSGQSYRAGIAGFLAELDSPTAKPAGDSDTRQASPAPPGG
jgi:pimeloyl-ACP methyl ester carboxylesterase